MSFFTTLRFFSLLFLLTGIAYPYLITLLSFLMPMQTNGSLLYQNNEVRGSFLISQKFTQDHYFWPRPSSTNYNTMPSGASHLAPTSLELKEIVLERINQLGSNPPTDLIYASGSGLDPHISLAAAYFQTERVAAARGINKEKIKELIDHHKEGHQLGFLSSYYVNVLLINNQLDQQYPKNHAR